MVSLRRLLYLVSGVITGITCGFVWNTARHRDPASRMRDMQKRMNNLLTINEKTKILPNSCNCSSTMTCGSSDVLIPHPDTDYTHLRDFDKEDKDKHHDNTELADALYNRVKIIVSVITKSTNLKSRAAHVNITWGQRANKLLFVSDRYDAGFPTVAIEHGPVSIATTFDYLYEHHVNDYDWFMISPDDSYVIMENLRYFLSGYNPEEPQYFVNSKQSGYVVSRQALKAHGQRRQTACTANDNIEECFKKLGVTRKESKDNMGRERFHDVSKTNNHVYGFIPDLKKDRNKQEMDTISDYAITFDKINMGVLYQLEFFIYHLQPYGIQHSPQDLNIKQSADNIALKH